MRFELLLFDLDGTLVDSHREICLALSQALTDLRVAVTIERVEQLVDGSPLESIWDELRVGESAQLRARAENSPLSQAAELEFTHFAAAYRQHYMRDLGHASALFPEVHTTLTRLKRLDPAPLCAVVSNKSHASVAPLLERLGIAPFFDLALGCGGTTTPAKPAPDLLLSAARQLGCDVRACAMIGDTVLDVEAGKRAGMTSIAISHGMGTQAALATAGADHLLPDFSALASLLLNG